MTILGGFGEVYRSFGIEQINDEGSRLLDWAGGKGLRLINRKLLVSRKGEVGL